MSPIERLEDRTLFAAAVVAVPAGAALTEASAVADRVAAVQVDRASVAAAARDACGEVIALGRDRLESILETRAATLAADREQLRAATGDAAAVAAAKAKLKADRAQIRADLAAARGALAADTAECRAALKRAVASLGVNLKQLKADLRAVTPAQRQAVHKLTNDLAVVQAGSGITAAQIQDLVGDVRAAVQGSGTPDAGLLRALFAGASVAFGDGELSLIEQAALLLDLQAVIVSANVPAGLAGDIVADLRDIAGAANVESAEVDLITSDLLAVYEAFRTA